MKDLSGQSFGCWTVIKHCAEKSKPQRPYWICECSCGIIKSVSADSLKRGKSTSCGCYQKELAAKQSIETTKLLIGRVNDLVGQRFGRLLVLGYVGRMVNGRHSIWLCGCDCGQEKEILRSALIQGRTKSCGCLQSELASKTASTMNVTHGDSGSVEHLAWRNMLTRCYYDKCDHYGAYGGRGITVCNRWRSYENFLADLGRKPDGFTLERIDTNKSYEPSNCKWATWHDQHRNRRSNHNITINGETMILTDWCRRYGKNISTVSGRLSRGWSELDALTK